MLINDSSTIPWVRNSELNVHHLFRILNLLVTTTPTEQENGISNKTFVNVDSLLSAKLLQNRQPEEKAQKKKLCT